MRKSVGRILALTLALALILSMAPAAPARAASSVQYFDWDDDQKKLVEKTTEEGVEVTEITSSSSVGTTLTPGWYIVEGSVTFNDRILINADTYGQTVNLILADGCTLTANKGIGFSRDSISLKIYGQSAQSGKLVATGEDKSAAIGGGEDYKYGMPNSNLTINGGVIEATTTGSSAAIGCGTNSFGYIVINGGKVTAKAGEGNILSESPEANDDIPGGAGIGAGVNGTIYGITINGGTVNATGGPCGAGIGGGYNTRNPAITINGGTVTAIGGPGSIYAIDVPCGGPGIGCGAGCSNSGSAVTINGGTVTAAGGMHERYGIRASGIGNKYRVTQSGNEMNLNINGGTIYTTSIDENAKGNSASWNGIVFDGPNGLVYGNPVVTGTITLAIPEAIKNVLIDSSDSSGRGMETEIFSNYTLDIPSGSTLTVGEGGVVYVCQHVTLNVGTEEQPDGKLVNNGFVIIEYGTICVYGVLEGNPATVTQGVEPFYQYQLSPTISNFDRVIYGYDQPAEKSVSIKNTGEKSVTIQSVALEAEESDFILTEGTPGELAAGRNQYNSTWKIQPKPGLSAGTHRDTVTITYGVPNSSIPRTATVSVWFTVSKASATVTAPKANTLTYTGAEQALVTEGSVTGPGTMKYSLTGRDDDYTDTIPTGKDAGSYTVYWKVDGMDETNYTYSGVTGGDLPVDIGKADSDVTLTAGENVNVTYGDSVTLSVNVSRKDTAGIALVSAAQDHVTFSTDKGSRDAEVVYYDANKDSGTATVTIEAKDVKNYFNANANTVTVSYGGSGNLNSGSAVISVTVNPKTLSFTFTPETRAYNGTETVTGTLNTVTEAGALDGDDVTAGYTANMEDANAGNGKSVNVTVNLSGADADYYTAANPVDVTVNIEKADARAATAPNGKNVEYNGEAQVLIDAGTAEGGTMKYYLGESAPADGSEDWKTSASDIKGTQAQSYTIWYYIDGDINHNDTAPASVTATISKAAPTVTSAPTAINPPYTGNAQALVTAGTAEGGTMMYALGETQPDTGSFTEAIPQGTNAETYHVWYMVKGDDDHDDTPPVKVDSTIGKAASSVTVAAGGSPTYGEDMGHAYGQRI